MNRSSEFRDRTLFLWPLAGIVLGLMAGVAEGWAQRQPIAPLAGPAIWAAVMLAVAVLGAQPSGARMGVLLAGLLVPLPVLVDAAPMTRFLLGCCMATPFLGALELMFAPPMAGLGSRVTTMWAYLGRRGVTDRPRSVNVAALLQLTAATAMFAASLVFVRVIPTAGTWLPVRWLAGAIMVLAFAEMASACPQFLTGLMGFDVRPLFHSPYRSTSINEFWTKRWNLIVSDLLSTYCFAPLARYGVSLALFATFTLSAVAHAGLVWLAVGNWQLAVAWGAFFLVQPFAIIAERRMNVRRWPQARAWLWTTLVLAVTSPLFVEPVLRMMEWGDGAPENVLGTTAVALGFIVIGSVLSALGAVTSREAAPQLRTQFL